MYCMNDAIRNAEQLRDKFREHNRDSYPHSVYVMLFEYLIDLGMKEFDVVGLCCDIQSLPLKDAIMQYIDDIEPYIFTNFEDLRAVLIELISDDNYFLGFDDDNTFYFI